MDGKRLYFLVLIPLLLVLAACGRTGGAATSSSGEVTVTMTEYKFEPDTIRVKAGQEVRITLENKGEKEHEFMVGRDVGMEEGFPDGFHTDFFEGIEVEAEREGQPIDLMELMESMEMEHHGFMAALEAGDLPATLIFTVPEDKAGEWEIGCFEDEGQHYDDGMKGKLIVEK